MSADSTDRRATLAFAAILAVYSGCFSIIWAAMSINPRLGGFVRGALALVALPLAVAGLVLNRRLKFPALAAFGLLPYFYLDGAISGPPAQ